MSKSNNYNIIKELNKLIIQIKFQIDHAKNNKEKVVHSYRLQSINKVIDVISKYPKKINNGEELKDIKGIGKGTIDRINEILQKGKLEEIQEDIINKNYLKYVEELEEIYGIGRKTAIELITKHKIKSIKDLKKLVDQGKIELPENVLKGLKYHGIFQEKIPRSEMDLINNYLLNKLKQIDKQLFGVICGSYRRLKATSNDIDMLIVHPDVKSIMSDKKKYLKKFIELLIKDGFIVETLTDPDVPTKFMGFSKFNNHPVRRIDIRFIPYESYYYALLYFTGSKDLNKMMRQVAIDLGLTLNEYGLYDKKGNMIKANSEKEIFELLGLEFISPEFR